MSTISYKGHEIIGHSIAGHATTIIVKNLKLCFDMGVIFNDWVHNCDTVCISHGHSDHIGCLHLHSKLRRLYKLKNPDYILPKYCVNNFNNLYKAVSSMDKGLGKTTNYNYNSNHYNIIVANELAMLPDDNKYYLKNGLYVLPIKMNHKILDVAYVIIEERKKLKDEYLGLSGKELAELRKNGTDITTIKEFPTIAYSGDTKLEPVINNDLMMNSQILILECSFIDDNVDIKTSHKRGHTHLYEIRDNIDKFKNECIILIHFSGSYNNNYIKSQIKKELPGEFRKRVKLLLSGER